MRVRDLQEFLSSFTEARDKSGSQGKVMLLVMLLLYVEVRRIQLHEIKKMEVHENSQTIFGVTKQPSIASS